MTGPADPGQSANAIARGSAGDAAHRTPSRRSPGALWLAAVAVLAAALAVSLAAPPLAGAVLRIALARSLGTGDVAVTVRAWPPQALWWGNIGMLSVAARSVRVGVLDVAAFNATLNHVDVDAGLLYGRGELAVRSVRSGTARVMITADNLARLVAAQPAVKQVVVHIRPGLIVLDGTVSVFGADFPASVTCHLVVRDPRHLDLAVDRVTVMGGVPVPPDVASRFAASINPVVDLSRLPFGLRLTGVTHGNGVVVLQAAAGGPPAAGRAP